MKTISNEIVKFEVKQADVPKKEVMHEGVARPESLTGCTYKLKVPSEDSAIYITINDIVLNKGTDDEERRPFEMFINSRNAAHRQWVDALTRVVSAVFRKGGEVGFLVEELKAISDPNGGGFYKGRFVKSVVSEIGHILETHISPRVKEESVVVEKSSVAGIDGARVCKSCGERAVVQKDGCPTCLSCGDSKCG